MTTFADLGLSERALNAVEKLGYDTPTPVQEQAIPYVMEGRDVIAAASTGTGKTAAFLLPTMGSMPSVKRGRRPPRMLVVSPTRELAQQIAHTAMQVGRKTNHFVTTVFGGSSYGPQINEIRRGTDILIATPGRLNDLIDREVVDLGAIEVLVLDEADRMLDMGFLPDVTKIVEQTPTDRQTLLFSATIDESIQNNLGSLLRDPAVVEVSRNGETARTVEQFILPIKNFQKQELLEALLEEKGHERVIVFARTKFRTEECMEALRAAGYQAESIHSDKNQSQRRRALNAFRKGDAKVLVATDVLARGIDVPEVDYVVNFDLPDMPEDYVHRIGRTGRAGEEGLAISFVTRESRKTLREIEHLIGKDLPYMELESFETDPSLIEKGGKDAKGSRRGGGKRGGAGRNEGRNRSRNERGGRREGQRRDRDEARGRDEHDKRRGGAGRPGKSTRTSERGRDAAKANERSTRGFRGDFHTSQEQDKRSRFASRPQKGAKGGRGPSRTDRTDERRGGYRGSNRDERRDERSERRSENSNARNAQQRIRQTAKKHQVNDQAVGPDKPAKFSTYDYSKFVK
ncbi:DEAD/DEAH box helicase [Xiamenia xianingshaonis]|uniref:DEAD/DEAH box helicase n=1 Tax=Xiamenia xianingshaonis TaxID=2682776 RepID=A0A9E6SU48_9ACTN|nr:DEAD/DEAH box helicase [Xiamenia xianingshaonis]NHM14228.1 DEAD/DEAH box helicase [Xiamenia xianingshaonis]QTU84160.1 DEAD/DEAH box helicase [Xiamenia xianingshaonis]